MFWKILSAVTLMSVYVCARSAAVPLVKRYIPHKYLWGIFFSLWGVFVLNRIFHHQDIDWLSVALEIVGMGWAAVLFLLFIMLAPVDVVTLFGYGFSRWAPSLRGYALFAGFLLVVTALVQGLRPPAVQNYTLSMAALPKQMDGLVIAAVSDLHLGRRLGKAWLAARVEQIQKLKPDVIVLIGDIFDGQGGDMAELLPEFCRLGAPLGVFAVLGNHEFFRGTDSCVHILEQAGITVLRNCWVEARPGLILAGVDDLAAYRYQRKISNPMIQALAGRPRGITIFLSHTPLQTENAALFDVDLMLSGHTHAGQIWPLGYIIRQTYPMFYGLYQVKNTKVIVTRGAGSWGPIMRLWRRGEILRITLRANA